MPILESAIVIVQARLGSTRLPRKVLETLPKRGTILNEVLQRSRQIGAMSVVLSCPYGEAFELQGAYNNVGIDVREGPHPDLLTCYAQIAQEFGASYIVRITSDCPLMDPLFARLVLQRCIHEDIFDDGMAYAHNTRPGVDGLDAEAFTIGALLKAYEIVESDDDRHHVTQAMRDGKVDGCKIVHVPQAVKYEKRCPDLSVDTAEDLARVRSVFEHIEPGDCSWYSTLQACRKAGLIAEEVQ